MTSRRFRTISAAAALLTAAALSVPAAAWAGAPAQAGTVAASAAPTVKPAGAGAAAVVLPTGDRLVVHTGTGAQSGLSVDSTPDGSDSFAGFRAGGDRYLVPSEAQPYLGHALDVSLFDVTKLAAATPAAAAHIPVRLTFATGVTPTAPAGVTFTSVSGQSATGYLTPASGKAFAQALRDGIRADLAAGHRPGTTPLFGGLTSMAAAGASAPVTPFYPLHILQLNTLDSTGAASNAMIVLINTDNAKAFTGLIFSYQGIARVAVPAGNYAAISPDTIFNSQAQTSRTDLVSQDGISVPATGTVPVATLDERTATSLISFHTPQPASQIGGTTAITRTDPNGVSSGLTMFGGPGTTYVSPEAKPATGTLTFTENWLGASPATAAAAYRYNLVETSDHIDADQTYTQSAKALATLKHTFSQDPSYGTNLPGIGSGFLTPDGALVFGTTSPSQSLTEYVTSGLTWFSELTLPTIDDPTNPNFDFAVMDDDPTPLKAGQTIARDWAHAPEVPNVGRHTASGSETFGCQACSSDGNLNLTLGILGDGNPDTTGIDFGTAGTAQLYWNGQLVSSDVDQLGYTLQNVAAAPGTLRAVFDYDRTATGITQSAKTHTDITVPYSGKDDPSQALPSGIFCAAAPVTSTGVPTAPCSVLPALTLNYQLSALTNKNTSLLPFQNLVLNVGHLSYGGIGSRARIASAQVSVSFDNGATWQNVPTYGYDGIYDALWRNPAAGSPVELRVTATDSLGGSITQTVTNPYTVGAIS